MPRNQQHGTWRTGCGAATETPASGVPASDTAHRHSSVPATAQGANASRCTPASHGSLAPADLTTKPRLLTEHALCPCPTLAVPHSRTAAAFRAGPQLGCQSAGAPGPFSRAPGFFLTAPHPSRQLGLLPFETSLSFHSLSSLVTCIFLFVWKLKSRENVQEQ